MELGGMDPFMVKKDANVLYYILINQIKKAVELAIRSRITNCGNINNLYSYRIGMFLCQKVYSS